MFKWFGKVNYTPYTKVSDFARHLREGRIMASRCTQCGTTSFPPRADCANCMSGDFEFVEITGRGTLHTYTRIVAAPTGFDDVAPYTLGLVDLEEGGKALAWIGETIPEDEIVIGMEVQLVPRIFDDVEEITVDYTVERPGTTWTKAEAGAMATAGTT
jgi:uncharacterized OB-fold protein